MYYSKLLLGISTWGAVRRWWGSTWSILVTMSWKTYVDITLLQPVLIPGRHIPNFVTWPLHLIQTQDIHFSVYLHTTAALALVADTLMSRARIHVWIQMGHKLLLRLYHFGQFFAFFNLFAIWNPCFCLAGRLNLCCSLPDNKRYLVVLDKMQRAVIKINIWRAEH